MSNGRALIAAYDVIGPHMAGPGLRSLRLAEAVAASMPVDLLIGPESSAVEGSTAGFVAGPTESSEEKFLSGYTACLASSTFPLTHPWLMRSEIPLAVDCYDPYVLENLFLYASLPPGEAAFQHERHLKAQIEALLRADVILCASERQKDLFTGASMALNRLNPGAQAVLGEREFIRIVPFGIEENEPPARGSLRGKAPGYGVDDEVLIWGGGIWDWFDPLGIINAVHILKETRPNIRLHFLGVKHPNRHIPFPKKAREAIALAEKLGLKDKHVFFGEWVEASERGKYLSDADLGVSFHRTGFETRYSFRTRLMDYLWAELPMVVSSGDDIGKEFVSAGLGEAVADNSPEIIADAVGRWLDKAGRQPDIHELFATLKARYRWPVVARPAIDFLREPYSLSGARGGEFFTVALGGMNPSAEPGSVRKLIKRIVRPEK